MLRHFKRKSPYQVRLLYKVSAGSVAASSSVSEGCVAIANTSVAHASVPGSGTNTYTCVPGSVAIQSISAGFVAASSSVSEGCVAIANTSVALASVPGSETNTYTCVPGLVAIQSISAGSVATSSSVSEGCIAMVNMSVAHASLPGSGTNTYTCVPGSLVNIIPGSIMVDSVAIANRSVPDCATNTFTSIPGSPLKTVLCSVAIPGSVAASSSISAGCIAIANTSVSHTQVPRAVTNTDTSVPGSLANTILGSVTVGSITIANKSVPDSATYIRGYVAASSSVSTGCVAIENTSVSLTSVPGSTLNTFTSVPTPIQSVAASFAAGADTNAISEPVIVNALKFPSKIQVGMHEKIVDFIYYETEEGGFIEDQENPPVVNEETKVLTVFVQDTQIGGCHDRGYTSDSGIHYGVELSRANKDFYVPKSHQLLTPSKTMTRAMRTKEPLP